MESVSAPSQLKLQFSGLSPAFHAAILINALWRTRLYAFSLVIAFFTLLGAPNASASVRGERKADDAVTTQSGGIFGVGNRAILHSDLDALLRDAAESVAKRTLQWKSGDELRG